MPHNSLRIAERPNIPGRFYFCSKRSAKSSSIQILASLDVPVDGFCKYAVVASDPIRTAKRREFDMGGMVPSLTPKKLHLPFSMAQTVQWKATGPRRARDGVTGAATATTVN